MQYSQDIFESPLSLILAAAFVIALYLLRETLLFKAASGKLNTAIVLGATAACLAVEGTWNIPIHNSIPFHILMLWAMVSLASSVFRFKGNAASVLSHGGIFIILFGGFFGAPDRSEDFVSAAMDIPTSRYGITLRDFSIDYYDDGVSPKQYTSTLEIGGKEYSTSVNHPLHYKGKTIYQTGFDTIDGGHSILGVVSDPWLPLIAVGLLMLFIGTLLELKRTWKSRKTLPVIIALAFLFGVLSLTRINLSTLVPALRSIWFLPHIMVYMLAYSIMAVALASAIATYFSEKVPSGLPAKLFATASCLLLIGMAFGAIWANAAWGDYWSWDAKENWAAATWLISLAGTHFPSDKKKTRMLAIIGSAFLAMQITWYGVNWLPSSNDSVHTYNRSIIN